MYAGITLDEIGGRGVRWQERPHGANAARVAFGDLSFGPAAEPPAPLAVGDGALRLSTRPGLWASWVTEQSPSLRFLVVRPAGRAEPARRRAPGRGVRRRGAGAQQRPRRHARRADPRRAKRGTATLIEGTGGQRERAGRRSAGGESQIGSARDDSARRHTFVETTGVWIIKSVVIFAFVMAVVPMILLLERKLLGRFQNRYGPNRVGPYGLLQPLADVVKLLSKEPFYPATGVPRLMAHRAGDHDRHRARVDRDHPLRGRREGLRVEVRALRDRRQHRDPVRVRVRLARLLRADAGRVGIGVQVLLPRRDARRPRS